MQDILNSINYFKNVLSQQEKELIISYTQEIDADDWKNSPLPLSYQVMNFVLKQRHSKKKDLSYLPELFLEQVLSKEDIRRQVDNAKALKCILDGFPKTTLNNQVYRGFMCNDYYFVKSNQLSIGQDFTVPYFLSTSIYPKVAYNFTKKDHGCIWQINILPRTPLAYIKDSTENCGECEVLLNVGATLRLVAKNTDHIGNTILTFDLIGYSKYTETRQFWPMVLDIASSYVCS